MQRISENDYLSLVCTNYINERIQPLCNTRLFFLFLPVTAALLPRQTSINHVIYVAGETSAVNFSNCWSFLPVKYATASVSVQFRAAARC